MCGSPRLSHPHDLMMSQKKRMVCKRGAGYVLRRSRKHVHPGEILLQEFLKPLGVSQCRLALDISVPPRRINEIVHGFRAVSADTALRLARYFSTSERFWLNIQSRFDLESQKEKLGKRLEREVTVFRKAG